MADSLPDDFLRRLLSELDGPGTVGFGLMGSHARGEAGRYSDVDLDRFTSRPLPTPRERYSLLYRGGRLVSVKGRSVAQARESLTHPEQAIWAVPGLQQARVLLDRDGSLQGLKEEAEALDWAPLQDAADEYASYELTGYAEEVHKVLGALQAHDESALAYATLAILLGLTRAEAVQRGVLIRSENRSFAQVEDAVGHDSVWASLHRQLASYAGWPSANVASWRCASISRR